MEFAGNLSVEPYLTADRAEAGRKFLRCAVIILMPLSVLAPVIRITGDFWLKLELFLLPVVAIIYFWLVLVGMARPIGANALFAVALLFCACVLVSILYGAQVIGHRILGRDFFEIAKAIIPVLFFTLALEADLSEDSLRSLTRIMVPAMLLICAYAYGQWANMGFTAYLQPLYSGGLHDDGGLAHYRRVYSTLSNPNYLGMLMTWMVAAFALAVLLKVGNRFWNIVVLFASLASLAMTGSRYGLINTALALVLIFFLPAPSQEGRRRNRSILLAAVPFLIGAFALVAISNRATLDRVQQLRNPLQENSLRLRLDGLWKDAGEKFAESPLVGHGPAKVIFGGVITDSEYLDILKEFGLIGFLVYLGYFLVPLAMIWSGLRRVRSIGPWLEGGRRAIYWAMCLSFIMIVTALVMNIGMSTYYNPSLLAMLWMWMGIGASCARRCVGYSQSIGRLAHV
jgi:O-antigen ligase